MMGLKWGTLGLKTQQLSKVDSGQVSSTVQAIVAQQPVSLSHKEESDCATNQCPWWRFQSGRSLQA